MEIVEELSDSGDECHRDLRNIKDKHSQKFAKNNFRPPDLFICCNEQATQITSEQYADLKNNLC